MNPSFINLKFDNLFGGVVGGGPTNSDYEGNGGERWEDLKERGERMKENMTRLEKEKGTLGKRSVLSRSRGKIVETG